ncbi:MAG: cytochrome c oxidase subunit I, partial [Proteobacteria bacterium]|nr:cytochrome c oxidase subunit I [Pseudomonadota bacterium]
ITTASTLLFFFIIWRTLTSGEKVPANQWGEGATTLEWMVESPAPFHTHEDLPDMSGEQPAE